MRTAPLRHSLGQRSGHSHLRRQCSRASSADKTAQLSPNLSINSYQGLPSTDYWRSAWTVANLVTQGFSTKELSAAGSQQSTLQATLSLKNVWEVVVHGLQHGSNTATIVAMDGSKNEVVGTGSVTCRELNGWENAVLGWAPGARIAEVAKLVVAPGSRRQGVGRKLLEACENAGRTMEPRPQAVALYVVKDNDAALELYESSGFMPWTTLDFVDKDGTQYNLEFFVKLL